ncbi:c-type cytochrome [Neorhodopirellula pilleata]|uniref:c-type cytochrome n=1 Tax=Neorhodopirellula pilleata TaxID=2714738 RepID=UPI0018CD372C|nr:c-type cytochrome [Neorhodopirellula pilleata]
MAPDLSRLDDKITDASLVESILEPSKAISEGYETLSVLTVDGRVFNGLVASQDDNLLVLRDSQDIDKLHAIPRVDVDESSPVKVSIMPGGLADQLTGRQQFLDLLRYVIDLKERGPANEMVRSHSSAIRELTAEMKGLILIRERNCTACHGSSSISALPAARPGPNLIWSAQRLNPRYLARFIADPQQTKPGSDMPSLLGQMDQAERAATAEAIVHFLISKTGDRIPEEVVEVDQDSIVSGRNLFHSVGCVACHSPRDESAQELPIVGSVPMGELRDKYSWQSLVDFLENPHVARPSGRMPSLRLARGQASDIANYLLQNDKLLTAVLDSPWAVDTQLVEKGKRLFTKFNCGQCHAGILEPNVASTPFEQLSKLNTDQGCLSDATGDWPDFTLTEVEANDIRAAVASEFATLDARQTIDFTLVTFRCTSCHSRDNLGGVAQDRRSHFQTTNENLGEQGSIPPTLNGVGAKLNPKWMRDVLVNGRSIRPYMKTRMPQFGESNIGHLIDLFQSTDELAETTFAASADVDESRKEGWKLVGNEGLNCAACHTYQYKLSDTMPAVDLTEMAQRLKKDWFYHYMLSPQKFSPNTVMPSYWPSGKALRADISGTPEEQIESIWQYLLEGRQARAPAGVVREPLEIVVTNEARMLRRQYPEIGKRGIGIGYPGGVNLAYDAQQMRLATVWKGKFADPSAAWYGQGSGSVHAMGPPIQLPKGPELYDSTKRMVRDDSRPDGYRFKGYSLDDQRRPTFRYEFGSVAVEDYFCEFNEDPSGRIQLRRHVTFTSSEERKTLRFRLASNDKIESSTDNEYQIGNGLTIRVPADQSAELVEDKQLIVPLTLARNQTQKILVEYLWE